MMKLELSNYAMKLDSYDSSIEIPYINWEGNMITEVKYLRCRLRSRRSRRITT